MACRLRSLRALAGLIPLIDINNCWVKLLFERLLHELLGLKCYILPNLACRVGLRCRTTWIKSHTALRIEKQYKCLYKSLVLLYVFLL
jgi:hypothetical protein